MARILHLQGCDVDLDRACVRRDGREQDLSPLETRLLCFLVDREGVPISQETLLTEVWGYSAGVETRAVYLAVHRLRKKIERRPQEPVHLVTLPGRGVMLVGVSAATRGNLRERATSFVGRARARASLAEALVDGPLVTLLGAGGMGKTRLALRQAAACAEDIDRWPGGAWFCDCASARDAGALLQVVAEVFQVKLQGADPAAQAGRIGRALAARGPVLVVLDNLEQVVEDAAPLVAGWIRAAPEARLLITSRRALGVPGEVALEIEPLSADEGVRLFVERARLITPGLSLSPEALEILRRLVSERLDGLPLAIELAAARASVLTVAQIDARLDQRFRLLKTGSRIAERRHAALRATIDWSWELLDSGERAALAACGAFAGGFDDTAASAVIGPAAPALLRRLESHSLIERDAERWRLLVSIRDYALEKLEDPAALERHRAHYLALGRSLVESLNGPGAVAALAALAAERQNLTAVHRRGLDGDPAAAAEAALVLDVLYMRQGFKLQHLALLDAALSRADALDAAVRANLLRRRGDLYRWLDLRKAREELERARELARSAGARRVEAQALGTLGAMHIFSSGGAGVATPMLEAALAIYQDIGDARGQGIALMALSQAALTRQDISSAEDHLAEALELFQTIGDPWLEADALVKQATLYKEQGDEEARLACLEAGLAMGELCDSNDVRYDAIIGLGNYWLDRGDLERSTARYEEALGRAMRAGDPSGTLLARNCLIAVQIDRGDLAGATVEVRANLAEPRLTETSRIILLTMQGLIGRLAGRAEQAVGPLEEAARRAEACGNTRLLNYTRLHLGPVLADRGRLAEAEAALDAAEESYLEPLDPIGVLMVEVGRAHVWLARGEADAARAVLAVHGESEQQEVRRVIRILRAALSGVGDVPGP